MLAALLNKRILLQTETSGKNAMGTPTQLWVDDGYTYATVKYEGGNTENNELGAIAYTNTSFTIRYNKNVDYKTRIIYNNTRYKIVHIEIIGNNEALRLVTIMFTNDDE